MFRWSGAGARVRDILRRLDGSLDVSDIAALTGATEEEVEQALAPLLAAGVLANAEGAAAAAGATAHHSLVPPGVRADGMRGSAEYPALQGTLPGLSEDEQRQILEMHGKLNRIDHYRLLGVAATADVKEIKRAYFALAKLYHPDRWFRRDTGPLRPKIDAIFAAMTNALDTLTSPPRRAAYDAYLREVLKTRLARRNAEALEARKDWAAAAEVWARVVEALPADAYVQHRYALALLRGRTDLGAALAAATRAIELDGTRSEYRLTAASAYLAIGRDRSALAELEVASELEPDRSDIAGLLAAVAERIQRERP